MPLLDVHSEGGVLRLTLDRPDALNAFTVELHRELRVALQDARRPEVRAVVLTGAGRAFSAGQDLEEAQLPGAAGPGDRLRDRYNPNVLALRALEKPVIAAVNGVTAGAGISLALACDIRIASEKASFVPAFSAIGLVPDSGATWFAARLLGEARAFEWFTSNRKLPAAEALSWGLVTEVVAPEQLLERAHERATALAALPGIGVAATKRLLARAGGATLEQQLEFERHAQQAASEHPDYAATVAEFLTRQSRAAR